MRTYQRLRIVLPLLNCVLLYSLPISGDHAKRMLLSGSSESLLLPEPSILSRGWIERIVSELGGIILRGDSADSLPVSGRDRHLDIVPHHRALMHQHELHRRCSR